MKNLNLFEKIVAMINQNKIMSIFASLKIKANHIPWQRKEIEFR
jgi:hypothetical protein